MDGEMVVKPAPSWWPRWVRLAIVGVAVWMALCLILAAQVHLYGSSDGAAAADVIVVLGAGLEPDGSAGEAMARRTAHAAVLYVERYAPAVICAGGFTQDVPISEAAVCAELLVADGVPRDAIWLEEASRSTEENAIFTAVLMREQAWQTALVTSDRYHLWRSSLLFGKYGITVVGVSPAQATTGALNPTEYLVAVGREVLALFWQVGKDALGLPYTHL